jgi:2'-5' RNA ligase
VAAGRPLLRTFVALPVAAAIRAAMGAQVRRLLAADPRLRAVPEANLHATLAFLGPTHPDDVERLTQALRGVGEGTAPIAVRYRGIGAFPSPTRPRVVWAGIEETAGAGSLAALHRRTVEALREVGFTPDDANAFHPHVTLGRIDDRGGGPMTPAMLDLLNLSPPTDTLQGTYGAETLSDLHLMLSEPGPGGSRYRSLARIPLLGRPLGRDAGEAGEPTA